MNFLFDKTTTKTKYEKMKVPELKDALRKLNLSTSGRNKDFIERLTTALQDNSEKNTTQETETQAPVLL